jgi:hypothetical protein
LVFKFVFSFNLWGDDDFCSGGSESEDENELELEEGEMVG